MDQPATRFDAHARAAAANLPGSLIRTVAQEGFGLPGVIPLWFGEPDAVTPDFVREAAKRALDEGQTFYTPNHGLPALREAIVRYSRGLGRRTAFERVSVTSSGVSAISLVCQTLLSPGDRVVVPTPVWPNLLGIPALLGAELVETPIRQAGGEWRVDLDALMDALTPDTRMVVLNAPGNPTGAMLDEAALAAILERCRRNGTWILADEVYERLVFNGRAASSILALAEPDDRVVSINSFSKSWAMTGWRLGWITAPPALMPAIEKVPEFSTSCAPGFVQAAGIAALDDGEPFVEAMVARLHARRDLSAELLGAVPGVRTARPEGAMYAFVTVEGCTDSLALARALLHEARVGVAPGRAFGPAGEGCLRLCFAVEEPTLREAIGRIEAFFRNR